MDIISVVWFLISDIINQEENNSKIGNEKDEDVELLLQYVDPVDFICISATYIFDIDIFDFVIDKL